MYVRNKLESRVNIIKRVCTINDFEYLYASISAIKPKNQFTIWLRRFLIKFLSKISHGDFYDFRYNPFSTKVAPSKCRCFDIETCKNTNFCKYARSLKRSNR